MSIIEKLVERQTHMRRFDDFQPTAYVECVPTGAQRDTISQSDEYSLSCKVEVRFWANRAQHDTARRHAELELRHHMFADLLADLASADRAISSGNKAASHDAIARLREKFIGD